MHFKKVHFILLGAPKCATTTLATILAAHEEIGFSSEKEPNFFSENSDWKANLKTYHAFFENSTGKIFGEASTTYSFYPKYNLNIWDDIFEYNPDMKFIYIVRNPIARTKSQYIHWLERGFTDKPFREAIMEKPEIIFTSKYFSQINPFVQKFGREKVLILKFEEFKNFKKVFLSKIADFLEIDADGFKNYEVIHENKSLTGEKKHHQFDGLRSKFQFVKILIPKSIITPIWNMITGTKKPVSVKSIEFNEVDNELIINMLEVEMKALETLSGLDLKDYYLLK